jgi:hypothetical protein
MRYLPGMNRYTTSATPSLPASRLVQAALTGLLSLGAQACGSAASPATSQADAAEPAHITSSRVVAGLTAGQFQAMCDARGGTVEALAHCGGLASARGFAYDTGTETLSEHTCKGANTCAGWNCVTPDES